MSGAITTSLSSCGLFDIHQRFQEGIEKAKQNPEDVTTRDYAYLKSLQARMEEIVVKWNKTLNQISQRNSSESLLGRQISDIIKILDQFSSQFMHCPTMFSFEKSDHNQAMKLGYHVGSRFDKQDFLVCYFGDDLDTSWLKDIITIAETGRPINATGYRPHMHFRMPGTGAQFAPTTKGFLAQNRVHFSDLQPGYRESLHSADILASNRDYVECAPDYFFINSMKLAPSTLGRNIAKDIVQYYLPGLPALKEKMQRKILETWIQFKSGLPTNSAGRFYVIAIPSGIYLDPEKNFVYRSHAYGKPCKPASVCVGEALASYVKPDEEGTVKSCDCARGSNPQVRIIEPGWASHRKNVEVYAFDSLNVHERTVYEKAVNHLGIAIHVLSRYRNALFFVRLSLCLSFLRPRVKVETVG